MISIQGKKTIIIEYEIIYYLNRFLAKYILFHN